MNEGKSNRLGKHGFGSLHNITGVCYHNENILYQLLFRFINDIN